MATQTKIKTRTRTRTETLNPRWPTSDRRAASTQCEPASPLTPSSDRVGAPSEQPAVRRQSESTAQAPVRQRSALQRLSLWVRHHAGAESAPSQQAIDAIADVAYFRHR